MSSHIVRGFVDRGFGFPVILDEVLIKEVGGESVPMIDYQQLMREVMRALPFKQGRLSGNETKFLRHALGMTLTQFGTILGVSHAAVVKWEKAGASPTAMSPASEKLLRLFTMSKTDTLDSGLGDVLESFDLSESGEMEHSLQVTLPH